MALDNFIPQVWSARLLRNLRKAHVLAEVANTDWEGEITEYGDTVKINSIGPVTVRNYDRGDDLERDELDDEQTVLTIDQAKYFNFGVNDIDQAQQRPQVMDEAMDEAAHALVDESDSDLAGLAEEAGGTEEAGEVTAGDVYELITEVNRRLDENNVPETGRYGVIPPWFKQKIVLAKLFEQGGSFDVSDVETEGYIGRTLGFDWYMSNNLVDDHGADNDSLMMFGTRRAMSFAEQILTTEAYRPENSFEDAVKGLYVYGYKMIDPNCMYVVQGRHGTE